MNYDITFCSNKNCKQECFRNQNNIDKEEIDKRSGIWLGSFPTCKYFKEEIPVVVDIFRKANNKK